PSYTHSAYLSCFLIPRPPRPTLLPYTTLFRSVIAALVIGGGAWAVTRSLAGGGNQPASALPAETAAYVRLDIDPSLGQKIAAVRFLDGLDDDVLDDLREGDFRETFFEWMAEDDPAFESIHY